MQNQTKNQISGIQSKWSTLHFDCHPESCYQMVRALASFNEAERKKGMLRNPGMFSAVSVECETVKQPKVGRIDRNLLWMAPPHQLIRQLFGDSPTSGNHDNCNFCQNGFSEPRTGNRNNLLLFTSLVHPGRSRPLWHSPNRSQTFNFPPHSCAYTERQEAGKGNCPEGNTNKAASLALQYRGIHDSDTFANDQAVAGSTGDK